MVFLGVFGFFFSMGRGYCIHMAWVARRRGTRKQRGGMLEERAASQQASQLECILGSDNAQCKTI